MKYIATLLSILFALNIAAQENKSSLTLSDFEQSTSDAQMKNLASVFRTDWPKDGNTGKDCAWIRIKYVNMSEADLESLSFKGVRVMKKEFTEDNRSEQSYSIFVAPVSKGDGYFEVTHNTLGTSNRIHNFELKEKAVYYITLRREASTSIIVNVRPENVKVVLDDTKTANAKGLIEDVALGEHTLGLSINGRLVKKEIINVTEDNIRFDYDLRKKREIQFTSESEQCDLYIDGELAGRTPTSITLPYGSYHIEARITSKENDIKDITIDEKTQATIEFKPIPKKRISFKAQYNGNQVATNMSINDKPVSEQQLVHVQDLPIGKRHKVTMSYNNLSSTRNIAVRKNMNSVQEFTISAKNSFLWPWERLFDDAPWGFSVGYVSKQWVTRGGGHIYRGNAAWAPYGNIDTENRRLHGIQLGWQYNPCFEWGLGLHTGIFTEIYMSKADEKPHGTGYNSAFKELSLYVPAHLMYRFPIGEESAFYLHGGFGLDFGLLSAYTAPDAYASNRYNAFYGQDGFPNRFNLSSEIGFGLRYGRFMVDMQYSKGITNHKDTRFSYFDENQVQGETRTKQNKLSLGLSYMYGGDYDTDWIWDNADDEYDFGVTAAYVTKNWVLKGFGQTYKGNAMWGDLAAKEGKRMHGFQVGMNYNPGWKRGLGMHTGMFFEFYFSSDDELYTQEMSLFEMTMYIPLHLTFWVPLGDEAELQLRGGLGIDCGLFTEYKEAGSEDSYYTYDYDMGYGVDGFPERMNYSAELGLAARIGSWIFFGQVSRGLNSHESLVNDEYESDVKVSQNKLTFGFSYNIGD